MASKEEALEFLSEAIDLEGKELVELLNGLLSKVTGSRVKETLMNLRDDAKAHKETFEKLRNEVMLEVGYEY